MRMPPLFRLGTALSISCVCSAVMVWGVAAAQFGFVRTGVIDGDSKSEALRPWAAYPGLESEALRTSIRYADRSSLDPRPDDLSELERLLAVEPSSGQSWLLLAGERYALVRSAADVSAALQISWITAPNEGDLQWNRGALALLVWSALPENLRQLAVSDLTSAMSIRSVSESQMKFAQAVVQRKSPSERVEIGASLRAIGFPAAQLTRLGL